MERSARFAINSSLSQSVLIVGSISADFLQRLEESCHPTRGEGGGRLVSVRVAGVRGIMSRKRECCYNKLGRVRAQAEIDLQQQPSLYKCMHGIKRYFTSNDFQLYISCTNVSLIFYLILPYRTPEIDPALLIHV